MKLRLERNGSLLGIQKKIPLNAIILPPLSPALSESDVEVIGIGHVLVSGKKKKQGTIATSAKIQKIPWCVTCGKLLSLQKRLPHPRAWHGKLNNQYFCVGVWLKRLEPPSQQSRFENVVVKKGVSKPTIIYMRTDSSLLVFLVRSTHPLADFIIIVIVGGSLRFREGIQDTRVKWHPRWWWRYRLLHSDRWAVLFWNHNTVSSNYFCDSS